MRNLKKVLSVLLVVAMLATAMVPAFAADATYTYSAQAQTLNTLGLYKGVSTTEFNPDLGATLDRQTGVVMLLRIFALDKAAEEMKDADVTAALAKFTDADTIADWAKKSVAYAVKNGLVTGTTDTEFAPVANLNGKAYTTLILRQLGFTVDAAGYDVAPATLAEKKGLTADEAKKFAAKDLIKDDLVGISFGSLAAVDTKGKTVIENLVAAKAVDAAVAEKAGVYKPVAAVALDVASAVAINSKIVEVSLTTAVTTVNAADVTVKDAAGTAVAVAKAEIPAYVTDGKKVLVTLEKDTVAGTLYTLTANAKSVNFGGKAADTTKPEISSISSTDYNQVTVVFKESIKFDAATFVLAEKYGNKTALNVVSTKYSGSTTVILTTDEQKDATLYGYTITGVTDFAGNVMDKKEDSFIGTKKPTDVLKVAPSAASNNPEEITVEFNVNVDPATIAATAFKVEEMYGNKAVLEVTAARLANKDEMAIDGTTPLTDTTKKKYVVLSVVGTKDATLYKVTATGLKTLYGKDQSTTASETYATAIGKAKPTTVFDYTVTGGAATSNTSVELVFDRKVVKADAENIANYAINEAYGNKDALTITKAVLSSNGKTLTLTTAATKTVLYKITVSNIKDIYGNALKTESSANVDNFSGIAVATKITSASAEYDGDSKTVLVVTFDQNVGANATDVSLYTIDNSAGYPEKVVTVDGNKKQVKLTLPLLTDNKTYKLTVKGLNNADGVAMGTEGAAASFLGRGVPATLPELVAVMATDNQTLKVYFDRDVTDGKIKGPIWDSNVVKPAISSVNVLGYKGVGATDVDLAGAYAFQDPENKNVLVIRVAADAFKSVNKDTTINAFKLNGNATLFKTDKNSLLFANKEDAATTILVDAVMALNKTNVRVYFNQPVYGTLATFADINTTKTNYGAAGAITLSNPVAIDATKKVYDFATSAELAGTTYWLNLDSANGVLGSTVITDKVNNAASNVVVKDEDTGSTNFQHRQFAGNSTAVGDIKEVSVIMTDARTMVVYYPTLMKASKLGAADYANSVLNPVNYTVYKTDGTTPAVMVGDTNFATADIAKIAYDSTQNTATITFNKAVKDITSAKLAISQTVKNATLTASVKDGTTTISKLYAIGTADAAKVTVTGATYTASAGTLKISFSQPITTLTAASTATEVVAALKITYKNDTGTEVTLTDADFVVTGATGTTQASDAVYTTSIKDITLTLTPAATWKAEGVGKVQIQSATALYGINGVGADKDATFSFAQK